MNYIFTPLTRSDHGRENSRDSMVSSYEYDEEFEMLVAAFLRDMNYTSVNQTALNIIYSMINAALIALPYAASQGGVPLYASLIFVISLMSAYTSIIVVSMANEQKVRTLEDLAECAFGPRGFFAVSFFQMLFSFALMCITLDVYADIMVDVFKPSPYQSWILTNRVGQLIIGSVFVVPLCIMKTSMSNMKWTSYVTVCAMCAALTAVICTYLADASANHAVFANTDSASEVLSPKSNWWFTLFLAVFSFSCNQKVMTVYSSLRQRSVARWKTAVKRSHLLLLIMYLMFGVFGYISVRRMDMDINNVNFFVGDGQEWKNIYDPARVTVAIALLLTIPVDCLVAATTWRRFHSKYMKIYHCQSPVHASPVPSFFDKCFVRMSILNSTIPIHDEGNAKEEEEEEEDEWRGREAEDWMEPEDREERGRNASTDMRQRSLSQNRSQAGAPNTLAIASPARFTRRSKPHAHPSAHSMRSASSGGGISSSRSRDKDFIRDAVENDLIGVRDSFSEEREVDESGWSVYSNLLSASSAAALQSHYEESKGTGRAGSKSPSLMSPEDVLAQHVGFASQERDMQEGGEAVDVHQTSHSYIFGDFPVEGGSPLQVCWARSSPALTLYTLCFLTCLGIQHWLYLAASVCTLSTAILLFIFPSILYFRLGLVSDYQSIPLIYNILPNQVYMYIIQVAGMMFIIFDVLLLFYFVVKGEHFVESKS